MPEEPKFFRNLGTNIKLEKTVAAQWFFGFVNPDIAPNRADI